jgi:hypothetical protein
MKISPDRVIVGLATVFDQPCQNDGTTWAVEQFADFLGLETALPLMINHDLIISSWGVLSHIGTVRRFAAVDYPVPGLLALALVDEDVHGVGDSILHDVQSILSQRWLPAAWGVSIGYRAADNGAVLPHEVSLTKRPAFADARVLGAGEDALNTWELLTEMAPNVQQRRLDVIKSW